MNRKGITEAREEALRFVRDADAVLRELDEQVRDRRAAGLTTYEPSLWGSAASGQLRRTSLDLTRSLARMRKP